MGLISCRVCGNSVSSDAKSCPHCGAPKRKFSPSGPGCLMLFLVLVALGIIGNCLDSGSDSNNSPKKTSASPANKPAKLITITTDNLVEAYEENEKSANNKYGYRTSPKRICILGRVTNIKTVFLSDGYQVFIDFRSKVSLGVFDFEVNAEDQDFIQNKMQIGDFVKVDSVYCFGKMNDGTIELDLFNKPNQHHTNSIFHESSDAPGTY